MRQGPDAGLLERDQCKKDESMRVIPVLTALLVTAFLYVAVFERDRLMNLARGGVEAEAPQETVASPQPAAAPAQQPSPTVGVVAFKSRAQVIDRAVILRGETAAARQVDVRAETSAVILSEPLRKGQFVEAGQELCRLDPGPRDAALKEMQARLNEARSRVPETAARLDEALARLEEARINDTAANRLSEGGFASDTRVATTKAALSSAQAGVESARAGLQAAQSGIQAAEAAVASARNEIDRLTIKAPFAGLLESDTAELGALMQPGSLCATVIQLDPIKLVGYVPETEVDRIIPGAMAGARLASGREVQGQVTFLSRSSDPTTRTFLVEVEVANPDFSIRDGQTAEIGISAAGEMAHKLPQSALTLNSDGKLGVRSVGADGLVEFQPVSVLRDEMDGVWLGGLPDEVDVIVVGQDFVTAGVRVEATYRELGQ